MYIAYFPNMGDFLINIFSLIPVILGIERHNSQYVFNHLKFNGGALGLKLFSIWMIFHVNMKKESILKFLCAIYSKKQFSNHF